MEFIVIGHEPELELEPEISHVWLATLNFYRNLYLAIDKPEVNMQTREPGKRVNWVFVLILIIAIPLIIFALFMMNTVPQNPSGSGTNDSSITESQKSDSVHSDTSGQVWKDTSKAK